MAKRQDTGNVGARSQASGTRASRATSNAADVANEYRAESSSEAAEERGTAGELLEQGKETFGAAVETVGEWASDARDAASDAMGRAQDAVAPLAESVRQNPWPALLISAGLTWLAADSLRGTTTTSRSGSSDYSRKGGARNRTAGRSAANVANVPDRLWRFVRENPLLAGAAAAGVGAVISMTLPETTSENELLGDTRDAVVDRAKDIARGTVRTVQEVGDTVQRLTRD
ncbi:MAG TPA: hypothetical protein VHJ77_14680 [Vicinamibacterales bacterium]|jgi:ElaB/YqjD/DUF883 family membrane-anchored ribosome-binding protein|nr:hypothetical protein [Vicinamibacterales bacterium]